MKPNGARLFLKKYDKPTQTASGIYMVNDPRYDKIENLGYIVAVGDDVKDKEGCQIGVRVMYEGIDEVAIDVEDEEYLVIPESSVVCFFYDKVGDENEQK